MAATLLFDALRSVEIERLRFVAETDARSAATQFRQGMQSVVDTFVRIARQYGDTTLRAQGSWQLELTGLQRSAWVEPSGRVVVVSPPEGNAGLVGTNLMASEPDRSALVKAGQTGEPQVTPSIFLPDGDPTFHVVVPILEAGQLRGFVVGVYSGRILYPAVVTAAAAPDWALGVFEGERELYRRGTPVGGWLAEATVALLGTERRLRSGPTPGTIARMQSPLPGVVLASGCLIAALLAGSVALAQSSRRRAREAEAAGVAVKTTQGRLAHVLASSPAVLYTLRVEGRELVSSWVSENIEHHTGYTAEDVADPDWWSRHLHPDDIETVLAEGATLLAEGKASREYRYLHKDGAYRWIRDEQVLIEDAAGRPFEVVGSWSDITGRKEAELNLRESEEQYRLLFENNPHPMWVYDESTLAYLAVNEAAVRHYGYSREEFLAMTLRDIRPPEAVPILEEATARRRRDRDLKAFHSPRVWKHRKKDGTLMDAEVAGSPIDFQGRKAWITLVSDVTEKKRLEAQLMQSQKMESIGRLAGGLAHDFNNLIGVITGYGELLQRDIGSGHPGFRRVEEIRKAADRAAALTLQLLAFSRKQVLEPKVLDLNAVVTDVEKMLRRLIGEDVQLITVFGAALGRVKADPGQVEQVIVNLAVNARDAMPQGGKLIIETMNVDLDEAYAASCPEARAGRHVMLAVSDTGHGMDADTQAHMFEPFFTTKEKGKGTGLGLATVHGIVRQSGGHVNVYSETARGTTFKVYLPRFEPAATDEPVAASPAAEPAPTGTETILLVEDESTLRVMVREMLESAGYAVLEAATPEEALDAERAHPGPIPLILTDVILPGMSGRLMAEALLSSRPQAQVLFMSGYTDDAISHQGVLEPGVHFLPKPFSSDHLLRKVREVLDPAPPGAEAP